MRNVRTMAAALTAAAVLPLAALAQQTAPAPSDPSAGAQQQTAPATTESTSRGVPAVMTEQQADQVLSDSYIGAKVVARSDQGLEDVGTVAELVLGPDDKIVGIVVDVGGFLGVGAKPVGLSWASLTEERAEDELLLKTELTRQDFEDAPEFKTLADTQVESDQQMMEGQTTPSPPAQ